MMGVFGMEGDGLPKKLSTICDTTLTRQQWLYSLLNKSFIVLEVSISSSNYLRQNYFVSSLSYLIVSKRDHDALRSSCHCFPASSPRVHNTQTRGPRTTEGRARLSVG